MEVREIDCDGTDVDAAMVPFVDALLQNAGNTQARHVIDAPDAQVIMNTVAVLLAERLWGPVCDWNLQQLTPEEFAKLGALMAPTEWRPCVACSVSTRLDHSILSRFNNWYLWQTDDIPEQGCGRLLCDLSPEELLIWCVPAPL